MGALAGSILDRDRPLAGAIKGGIGAMMAEVIAESLVDRQHLQQEVIQDLGLEEGHPLNQEDKALYEAAYREKLHPAMNTAKLVVASVMASFGHDPSIAMTTATNALENNFAGSIPEWGLDPSETHDLMRDATIAAKDAVVDIAEDVWEHPNEYVEDAIIGIVPYGDITKRLYLGETISKFDLIVETGFVLSGTNTVKAGGKVALKTAKKFGGNFAKRLEKKAQVYAYHPRIRSRALQDPVAHNYPYTFDKKILNVKPTVQDDGALLFRKAGYLNGKEGYFEIALNPETNVIFHRTFVRKK